MAKGFIDFSSGAASGGAAGATLGSIIPGLGTGVGAGIGAIGGGILGFFGGKSAREEDEKARQEMLAELDAIEAAYEDAKDKYDEEVSQATVGARENLRASMTAANAQNAARVNSAGVDANRVADAAGLTPAEKADFVSNAQQQTQQDVVSTSPLVYQQAITGANQQRALDMQRAAMSLEGARSEFATKYAAISGQELPDNYGDFMGAVHGLGGSIGAVGGAISQAQLAKEQQEALAASTGLTDAQADWIRSQTGDGSGAGNPVLERATGGMAGTQGPELTLLGEEGPELVLNAKQTRELASALGSSKPTDGARPLAMGGVAGYKDKKPRPYAMGGVAGIQPLQNALPNTLAETSPSQILATPAYTMPESPFKTPEEQAITGTESMGGATTARQEVSRNIADQAYRGGLSAEGPQPATGIASMPGLAQALGGPTAPSMTPEELEAYLNGMLEAAV